MSSRHKGIPLGSPGMMPGQASYTDEEREQLDQWIAEAAEGDPGEEGEREVLQKHRRLEFGVDDNPTWSRDHQNAGKRAYDRESKRRQRLRSQNAPQPLFFDDDPGPNRLRSGLIEPYVPRKQKADK